MSAFRFRPRRNVRPARRRIILTRTVGLTVRSFDGTGDWGTGTLPAALDRTTEAYTVAFVVKRLADGAWHALLTNQTSGDQFRFTVEITNTNKILVATHDGSFQDTAVSTSTLTVADGWAIIVVGKSAGNVAPRISLYKAGVWTHEDGDANMTTNVSANPSGVLTVGRFSTSSDNANVELAAISWWIGQNLADADRDNLDGGTATSWNTIGTGGGPTELIEFCGSTSWSDAVVGQKGVLTLGTWTGNGTIVEDAPGATIYNLGTTIGPAVSNPPTRRAPLRGLIIRRRGR